MTTSFLCSTKPQRPFQHKLRHFDMILRQLVEVKPHFAFDRTLHIRHFLRTLVDQQHEQFDLRMVGRNAVGNFFQQQRFPALGGATINPRWPSPTGASKIHNAGRKLVGDVSSTSFFCG